MKAVFEERKIEILPDLNFEQSEEITALYDLSSLKQFISDDAQALQNIISVFIESTKTSIEELKTNSQDLEKLSHTAHRMIPMLRQIESIEVVLLLEKLESKEIELQNTENHIAKIIEKLTLLTAELEKERK